MAKLKKKQVKKKQIKKPNIKKSKRNKKAKKIMVVFSLVLIIGFLTYSLLYFFTEPKFNIQTIEIKENNSKYENTSILEKLEEVKGQNKFLITDKKLFDLISEFTYIKDVQIQKREGSNIIVNIIPATPKYLVYDSVTAKYMVLDENGILLEITDNYIEEVKLLPVSGIVFQEDIKLRDKISEEELEKFILYEKIEKKFIETVESVQITSLKFENEKVSVVVDYSLSIILEENELDYDISNIPQILQEIKGSSGILDMTEDSPIYTPKVN